MHGAKPSHAGSNPLLTSIGTHRVLSFVPGDGWEATLPGWNVSAGGKLRAIGFFPSTASPLGCGRGGYEDEKWKNESA